MRLAFLRCAILALAGTAFITACDGGTGPDDEVPPGVGPDISLFFDGALAEDVTTEPCTQEPVRAHEAGQRPDHGGALRCNTNIT